MVSFGMPSLVEAKTVEQCAQICRELGLDFIELNANFPQFKHTAMTGEELKAIGEKYGIGFTMHLDDDLNVADFNDYVCQAYGRTVAETIELAKHAGISVLNMHLAKGAVYTLPHRKLYFFGEYEEEYLTRIRAFRDACQGQIGDAQIKICIENCSGWEDFHKDAIALLLESPVFAMTMDIGHKFCAADADEPVFTQHSLRLRHMHMHDALLPSQDHLPLGQGQMDIFRYIDLAQQNNCTVVLETKTEAGLRQSVAWLRQNGF